MIRLHTNYGDIMLELDHEKAPVTVQNFIDYVNSGHYDNTIFHRVIDEFEHDVAVVRVQSDHINPCFVGGWERREMGLQ